MRGYLHSEPSGSTDVDSDCMIVEESGKGISNRPALAYEHREQSRAQQNSNKQSNLKSFFQAGSRQDRNLHQDDDFVILCGTDGQYTCDEYHSAEDVVTTATKRVLCTS